MTIEIQDPGTEQLLTDYQASTGATSLEEVISQLLESRAEQERWIAENRTWIQEKIARGVEELDRGKGIGEDELDDYLAKLKSQPE